MPLAAILPYGLAFTLVTAVGLVLLPVAAWSFGHAIRAPGRWPLLLAAATLPVLALTGYSIYEGPPVRTLATEFTFTVALALGIFFLSSLAAGLRGRRRLWLPVVLFGLTVTTHAVAAALALLGALALWVTRRSGRRFGVTATIGAAAALVSAVWVLPLDRQPLCGEEDPPRAAPAPADDGALRIATYNLLHDFEDASDRTLDRRLELAADALHAAGADVVGAQEVVRNAADGAVARRLAAELAARSGVTWYWCWSQSNPLFPGEPDVRSRGGVGPLSELLVDGTSLANGREFREGLAVVTRFPISAARFHRLPDRSYEAPFCVPPDPFDCNLSAVFDSRQVLWARIGGSGGHAFDFFTTHIAHELTPLSPSTKLLQVKAALRVVERWNDPDTPDFLVGDFNSDPRSDRHEAVTDVGFVDTYLAAGGRECSAAAAGGCTGDPAEGEEVFTDGAGRTMRRRIDYVFARGCSVAGSRVIGTNARRVATGPDAGTFLWPSDHLGVVSTCRAP